MDNAPIVPVFCFIHGGSKLAGGFWRREIRARDGFYRFSVPYTLDRIERGETAIFSDHQAAVTPANLIRHITGDPHDEGIEIPERRKCRVERSRL